MFSNTSKQKSSVNEEELKPFEGMKFIIPVLTTAGETILSDPSIPIITYQLLKKFDGKILIVFKIV